MHPRPTPADVEAAAQRIKGVAHRTPVVTSSRIDDLLEMQVFFKCENLQRMGAFKFRGAYNALVQLAPDQRAAGVVAYSSGNHAQAIALSARILGIPATIVMPTDAPAIKREATLGYGAEVVPYDRHTEDREAIGGAIAAERGLTLVPPFDHPHVIAGQGTAALELLQDVGALDAIVTPMGGGGLATGSGLAAQAVSPSTTIFAVEPEAGDDGRQSLATGQIVRISTPHTIADGAQTQALSELTFTLARELISEVWTASDAQLVESMRLVAGTLKLIIEPTAALGLAGLLQHQGDFAGQRVGVVLSGGNVDLARFTALLGQDAVPDSVA